MDAPVIAGADGSVSVQATVDPVTGDTSSSDWSSLVLSNNSGASGYVSNPDVGLGILIRSNGGIQVFQGGTLLLSRAAFARPDAAGRFQVSFSYGPGQKTANLTVNGVSTAISAPAALPASSTLFMGAYLTPNQPDGTSTETSTLSNLDVSAVNLAGLALAPSSGLRYYGYYAARLAGCAPGSCVVYTGNEFFSWPGPRSRRPWPFRHRSTGSASTGTASPSPPSSRSWPPCNPCSRPARASGYS